MIVWPSVDWQAIDTVPINCRVLLCCSISNEMWVGSFLNNREELGLWPTNHRPTHWTKLPPPPDTKADVKADTKDNTDTEGLTAYERIAAECWEDDL